MEIDQVRLRTYRQVWSQERVIYQIDRVRLPFPVTFRQAGVFGASLAAMLLLSRIPLVAAVPGLARYIAAPAAITWFLTKQRLDGKAPLAWLLTMASYALSPKRLNRLSPVAATPAHLRFRGAIGYRAKG
jgi:hypothetical protein